MTAALGIERYVTRLRRRQRLGRFLSVFAGDGMVILVALLGLEALRPSALPMVAGIALIWMFVRLGLALMGSLTILPELDHALGLRDELATWSSADLRTRESIMFGWLSRSLDRRLDSLPMERVRAISRVGVGRLRYLLPFLVLLLLLRLLAPLLPPLPEGILDLQGVAGGGAGSGSGQRQQDAGGALQPDHGQTDQGQPEGAPPPPDLPPDRAEPGPQQPPKPLIDGLATDDSFLLPSFIGAGRSRPGQAVVGGLDETSGSGSQTRSAGGSPGSDDPQERRKFERALESALRSRHVPASERPFVTRYFEALLKRRR